MLARVRDNWRNTLDSLWFVPSVMALGAVALSALLLYVDDRFLDQNGISAFWLFGGSASAARSLLATIAGSLITVISIAFSLTIIALQQASTQFTPRMLRNFTGDRSNQLVLGTYIATFTYALLVMRQVREQSDAGDAFVPALSVAVAIGLALASFGMLIYFIHHISLSLQVSMILTSIREEVGREIEKVCPGPFQGRGSTPASLDLLIDQARRERRGHATVIRAPSAGYVRYIDEQRLFEAAGPGLHVAWVSAGVGSFSQKGSALMTIWSDEGVTEGLQEHLRGAFILGRQRTLGDDPLFGVQQIVDIGVKALSPGINDPTTAEQCLDVLGDILAQAAGLELPPRLHQSKEGTLFLFNRPDFGDYVDACLSQIRRASKMVNVTLHLLEMLIQLSQHIPTEERAEPLRAQVHEVLSTLEASDFSEADCDAIRHRSSAALEALTALPNQVSEDA